MRSLCDLGLCTPPGYDDHGEQCIHRCKHNTSTCPPSPLQMLGEEWTRQVERYRDMADRMTTSDIMSGGSSSRRGADAATPPAKDDTPVTPVKPPTAQSNPDVVEMLKKVDELHHIALVLENSDELADVLYKAVMLKESVMHYDQMMKERAAAVQQDEE